VAIPNLSVVPLQDYSKTNKCWDIFLCCTSFEDRCSRSSEILNTINAEIKTGIIHNYKECDPQNFRGINAKIIEDNLQPISNQLYHYLGSSVSDPKEGVSRFLEFLQEKNVNLIGKSVLIDITVFTKPFFYLLVKTFKDKLGLRKFSVIYTEPERYKTVNQANGEIILTQGLDRIESIPGFLGSSVNQKDALIIILGFEGKRALDVYYHISPEITFAINGFPAYQPGWNKVSLEANIRFLTESKAHERLYSAPAMDPFETEKVLRNICDEIRPKGLNIVIAPLGTKIQAFGAMLYALKDNDAKIVYPFPSYFKTDYSYKSGPSWIFEVCI
jgi:hypothetical protein